MEFGFKWSFLFATLQYYLDYWFGIQVQKILTFILEYLCLGSLQQMKGQGIIFLCMTISMESYIVWYIMSCHSYWSQSLLYNLCMEFLYFLSHQVSFWQLSSHIALSMSLRFICGTLRHVTQTINPCTDDWRQVKLAEPRSIRKCLEKQQTKINVKKNQWTKNCTNF